MERVPEVVSFYKGKAWRRCRDGFMSSKYFICERCGGVASIAHHRKHITPGNINNPEITLSWANLEALCHDCHNKEHMMGEAVVEGLAFDGNGDLVKSDIYRGDAL